MEIKIEEIIQGVYLCKAIQKIRKEMVFIRETMNKIDLERIILYNW